MRADLAHLEVCAIYDQALAPTSEGDAAQVFHVFARTRATPRRYYHRMRVISAGDSVGSWTSWQKLECDIEGDHLLPIALGTKLFLIWPLIREGAASEIDSTHIDAQKYEISLAWSVFDGTVWSAKSLSPKNVAMTATWDKTLALDPAGTFTFQMSADDQSIDVWAFSLAEKKTDATDQTTIPPVAPTISTDTKFPIPPMPCPLLTVAVTLDGVSAAGAIVSLTSTGPDMTWPPKPPTPASGAYVWLPPFPTLPVWGNTHAVHTTNEKGLALFGRVPTFSPEIVLGRSLVLTVTIVDAAGSQQTSGPITLTQWLIPGPAGWAQVRVDANFHSATVKPAVPSQWPPDLPVTISGVGGMSIQLNSRVGRAPSLLGELKPPDRTLPEGQWWRDKTMLTQHDALGLPGDPLVLPGQTEPTLQTMPGRYRLLPEPLVGPISSSPRFAFEVNDRAYLIERSFGLLPGREGGRAADWNFTGLFDAYAEWISERIASDPGTALSRLTQMKTDSGQTFGEMFFPGIVNFVSGTALPEEQFEFGRGDIFASENWETFFHGPLELADLLTRHNRFADAQRWLHTIYNPLSTEASDAQPWGVWQFLPFYTASLTPPASLGDILLANASERETVLEWKRNPFNPYAVARLRHSAFMKNVVMRYLDNLIAWGDQLFRQDTIESINEATQLYLLAEQILGEPPETVPARARAATQTFQSLSDSGLTRTSSSALGLLAVEISAFIEPSTAVPSTAASLGTMLYFCVPQSERLSQYWKTIQGRLQKIRRCENFEGRKRDLSLFDARIDPGLLVRAKAAGVDIGSILDDLYAPAPHYRFPVLAQKATELISEVRALGASMLSALEKQDAEILARLRQSQERVTLDNARDVREKQVAESQAQVTALTKSRDLATLRFSYYQRLLGDTSGTTPARGDGVKLADYLPASVPVGAGASDVQGLKLTQHETQQIDRLDEANVYMLGSNAMRAVAAILHVIPNTIAPVSFGGLHVGAAGDAMADVLQLLSTNSSHQASRLGLVGGFVRRQDDSTLQRNMIAQELSQFDAQLDGADIRVEIAQTELRNHLNHMDQSEAIATFFLEKYTNQELYEWMVDQLAGLYFQSYELAYHVAKQAEVAYRRDLGIPASDWIKFGHWDGLKRGLLAGEMLELDMKRMEASYLEQNAREYEITKHISLVSLNPNAFLDLKTTGTCAFEIPEWFLDLHNPGHYLRRIRSVSVTVPCVVGPLASVNCTVTLESSLIRTDPDSNAYAYNKPNDPHLLYIGGASESIVTSSGQADSGLFEANLRDDRYLPFESHGAVSRWRVALKSSNNGLVLESATDFILHLRYTAREGGPDLEATAQTAVDKYIANASTPQYRMLSLRHEYPTEWSKYESVGGTKIGPLDLTNRVPALYANRKVKIGKRMYFAVNSDVITPLNSAGQGGVDFTFKSTSTNVSVGPAADTVSLTGPIPGDLLVIFTYTVEAATVGA